MTRQQTTSPIHRNVRPGLHLCLPCSKAERTNVFATDPVTHVEECHPQAAAATIRQFAPRHQRIVRTAR